MTVKRIFPIALGLAMFAVAGVQGYAFMMAENDIAVAEAQIDVAQLIGDLKADELDEDAKLAKLDAALDQIDFALDEGVQDEAELLVARDAIVEMRLKESQKEVADSKLAAANSGPFANGILGGTGGGGILGGGGGLVGGGGGLVGGSSFGLLAAGAAAAIAIPAISSDDDDPAPAATVSN